MLSGIFQIAALFLMCHVIRYLERLSRILSATDDEKDTEDEETATDVEKEDEEKEEDEVPDMNEVQKGDQTASSTESVNTGDDPTVNSSSEADNQTIV